VDEVVDTGVVVELEREWLRLPGDDGPPLSVVRTTLPGGPTRPNPVVLVHGFAQNRFTWRISGRSMEGWLAARGFEVLNLELRGHGLSREYGAGNASDFHYYVEDALRVVRACDRPPFAIGHSLGGAVITGAATEAPLAGLVPIAGVFTFGRHNLAIRALARLSVRAEPLLMAAPVRMSTGWAGRVLGSMYSLTDIAGYGLPLAGWVPGSLERELLEERLVKGFDWTSVEVWLQMARWARGEPFAYAEAFREVDVPLLVVAGDSDPLLPPADARSCYEASGSDDATFLVMDMFGHGEHFGHVDILLGRHAPKLVWPKIGDWLIERS
jgi:pimeloyl-ACP methyl ester carboxylesterase